MAGNGNGNGNGELTGLQRAFVDEWFACRFNGTEAARRAGYQGDDNTLANVASQNLRKPKVKVAIEERWASHGVTRDEVIAHLAGWARFDPAVLYDAHGRVKWDEVRKHQRYIKRTERDGDKYKIEVHDPMRASEIILKHLYLDEEDRVINVLVDF